MVCNWVLIDISTFAAEKATLYRQLIIILFIVIMLGKTLYRTGKAVLFKMAITFQPSILTSYTFISIRCNLQLSDHNWFNWNLSFIFFYAREWLNATLGSYRCCEMMISLFLYRWMYSERNINVQVSLNLRKYLNRFQLHRAHILFQTTHTFADWASW